MIIMVVVACVSTPAPTSMCMPPRGWGLLGLVSGDMPPGNLYLLSLPLTQSWTKFLL